MRERLLFLVYVVFVGRPNIGMERFERTEYFWFLWRGRGVYRYMTMHVVSHHRYFPTNCDDNETAVAGEARSSHHPSPPNHANMHYHSCSSFHHGTEPCPKNLRLCPMYSSSYSTHTRQQLINKSVLPDHDYAQSSHVIPPSDSR